LGQSYYALKDFRQSLTYLKAVESRSSDTSQVEEARLLISRVEHDSGNPEGSLAVLRKLIRESGNRDVTAEAYLLRGNIFLGQGELTLALSQWQKSLLVAGGGEGSLPLYREMAQVLQESVTEEKLLFLARETPRKFPGDLSLYIIGKQAWEHGELIQASRIFDKFSSFFPGHPLLQEIESYLEQGTHIQSLSSVKLGCVIPLSGPYKEIGKQVLQGVRLSVDKLNAMFREEKVELVVRDSGGDSAQARKAVRELTLDPDVVSIIGPLTSRSVMESAMVAEDARLPLIAPAATAEGIGEMGRYIFRNAMTNAAQAKSIAYYAVEQLGLSSFAVLYPEDYYGRELNNFFIEEVTALGGEVLCSVSYERGAVDYGRQIRELIRKDMEWILARNEDIIQIGGYTMEEWFENYFPSFDAVYLPGYAEDAGLIVPQLAYYNIDSVQLLGSHYWNSMELIRRGEHYVEGSVFTDGFYAASGHTDIIEFVTGYRKAYGEEPTLFSAQAYDASEMILQVLYQGGRTREDIRKGLLAHQNFPGASGLSRVLESGEMEKELFLIQVEDERFKQIN